MSFPVLPHGFLGAQGDSDGYRIERSLRFNDDDAAYLSRTFGTPTDGKKCTLSLWYKRGNLGGSLTSYGGVIFSSNNTNFFSIADNAASGGDELLLWYGNARTLTSSAKFRDPTAWYHLVIAFDSTQSTAANRCKVYINGSEITSWATDSRSNITLNSTISFNTSSINALISGYHAGGFGQYDGYLAEYYFVDGQALTPSSFGETDAITGRWKAKAYSGTYGTNGFYLKFADNSGTTATTLGKDSSPNGNNWTPNNFVVSPVTGADNDSLVDSPTNYGTDTGLGGEVRGNYCVLNQNDRNSNATISNGNLDVTATTTWRGVRGTMGMSYGKWYWEFLKNTVNTITGIGNSTNGHLNGFIGQSFSGSYGYSYTGTKYTLGENNASYGSSYANGDIIGVAFDADSGTLEFFKNGTSQGTAYTSIPSDTYFPLVSLFSTGNSTFNFGQRPFAYTAPSGFKALCTQNLTQPTIQKPSTSMDVVTYTGTGASQSISSLGFSPDLVWIKGRSGVTDHAIYDTTRGVQQDLGSNLTTDETTEAQGLTAFGTNGFTIGTLAKINTSTSTYVAWAWNESALNGLDIVSYTGNGTARTISHNLGVAPKMIIVKARTTAGADQGWPVYHSGVATDAETDYLLLNSSAIAADLDTVWNDTAPTSSVFNVGTSALVNENNDTYLAYCFAEIEGFSKIGSWIGNGSADGPFLWCGFRPKVIIAKRSSTSTAEWLIFDSARNSFNVSDLSLLPSTNASESTLAYFDFVSNGIKIRSSASGVNGSGQTHIFIAFAESPFKYARAR